MWFFKLKVKTKKKQNPSYQKYKKEARKLIVSRLEFFAPLCNVTYKRIAIRDTKRSWGSCSSLGNLNFSYKLLFLPKCLSDYVIVHELCHLKELNHSQKFWTEVEKIMPEYKKFVSDLRLLEKTTRINIKALNYVKTNHSCQYCQGQVDNFHPIAERIES